MQGSLPRIVVKIVTLCGTTIALFILTLGSLAVTVQLAAADSQFAPAFQKILAPPAQISIMGCPSNPAITFEPTDPEPGEEVEFTGIISGPAGGGSATITWNFGDGSTEETGQTVYHIYSFNGTYTVVMTASGDSCGTPPTATTVISVGTGIAPASVIYLPVMFKNYPSFIFPTGSDAVDTKSDLTPPGQVTGLSGSISVDGQSTRLEWLPNPSAETVIGYQIYRAEQERGSDFRLLWVVPASATTYIDSTTGCGSIYYVTAFNTAGESPASTASYYSPACPE
jgi:PKD repeat protein